MTTREETEHECFVSLLVTLDLYLFDPPIHQARYIEMVNIDNTLLNFLEETVCQYYCPQIGKAEARGTSDQVEEFRE